MFFMLHKYTANNNRPCKKELKCFNAIIRLKAYSLELGRNRCLDANGVSSVRAERGSYTAEEPYWAPRKKVKNVNFITKAIRCYFE